MTNDPGLGKLQERDRIKMSTDNNRDIYESAFWHFIEAIRKLAGGSGSRYSDEATFETPWEMRENYFSGLNAIFAMQTDLFNDQQRLALDVLGELLRKLPIEALSPPNLPSGTSLACSVAMAHPNWSTIRSRAAEIIRLLDPLIRRNQAYFDAGTAGSVE